MHESSDGNIWVLTMIDQFTRWPVAVPIPEITSKTIAEAIFRYWICEKSVPMKILSDRGQQLISKGIQSLCTKLGISKITTGGYNPTGNASIERFHRYFGASLSCTIKRRQTGTSTYPRCCFRTEHQSMTLQAIRLSSWKPGGIPHYPCTHSFHS